MVASMYFDLHQMKPLYICNNSLAFLKEGSPDKRREIAFAKLAVLMVLVWCGVPDR